jgi:hypothetical protein
MSYTFENNMSFNSYEYLTKFGTVILQEPIFLSHNWIYGIFIVFIDSVVLKNIDTNSMSI